MSLEGLYIYCLIDAQEEKEFDLLGIGDRREKVYSVVFEDIAAVVSNSPVVNYSVSKENILRHIRNMEMIMDDYTILPVKFGTIASGGKSQSPQEKIKNEILKARYKELKDLLAQMRNKTELGLKAIWINMKIIFHEILEENRDIKILKNKISSGNLTNSYSQRIQLGEIVKNALNVKRAKEEAKILQTLNGTYYEHRQNKIFGDSMLTNSAFLVDKSRIKEFDALVEKLSSTYRERTKFKYVGPVPPCNFIELEITLKGDENNKNVWNSI